jgi:hypothetical protein
MEPASLSGDAFTISSSFWFCSICGKVFDEGNAASAPAAFMPILHRLVLTKAAIEIPHARHEKYCRRRAARTPRHRACQSCRRSKSKCDFRLPCSRCAARQIVCTYRKPGDDPISLPSNDEAVNIRNAASVEDGAMTVLSGMGHRTSIPMVATPTLDFGLWNDSALVDQMTNSFNVENTAGLVLISGDLFAARFTISISTIVTTYIPIPASTVTVQPSETFFSTGIRQHIINVIRAYPRMMTRPGNLPPFIHPHGCALHFDQRPGSRVDDYGAANFAPLHPLAACISIAHMFNSRMSGSEDLLWRTIASEQQRLMDEVCDLHLISMMLFLLPSGAQPVRAGCDNHVVIAVC